MLRHPDHNHLLGVHIRAQAKRTANIRADHMHALRRDAEAFGKRGLLPVHALAA